MADRAGAGGGTTENFVSRMLGSEMYGIGATGGTDNWLRRIVRSSARTVPGTGMTGGALSEEERRETLMDRLGVLGGM